jgi:hypothetical protein
VRVSTVRLVTAATPTPEPGRDLGPLIHALRRHGGTLAFKEWVSAPNSMIITLHLPQDEAQAEECRAAIDACRANA